MRVIAGISETFGMSVTAEGAETDDQALQLTFEACAQLQGHLFSCSLPIASVSKLIDQPSAASSADAVSAPIPA